MNGLTLRISRTGNSKSKNPIGYAPISLKCPSLNSNGPVLMQEFIESVSADEQLIVLKKILHGLNEERNLLNIEFLVTVFLQADAKHPVKCFLARYITKTSHLQQPFTNALVVKIQSYIENKPNEYRIYIDILSKLSTCIENFPAGIAAIRAVEINLAEYIRCSLECCISSFRDINALSPMEKNEIFNLAHLSLRLFLYVVQKVSKENKNILISMFNNMRNIIEKLLFDEDVPMDTKSVCGILYLSMQLLEFGPQSWLHILIITKEDDSLKKLLRHEASKLSLYAAIATVVPVEALQKNVGKGALLLLVEKIMEIGERSSSESVFILGVTRTLVQISKSLDKLTDSNLGLSLVDSILLFVWAHLDHYMDSVRHLTAQILGHVVKYCSKLKKQGNDGALDSLFAALTSLDRTRKSYYLSLSSLTNELGAGCVKDRIPNIIRDLLYTLNSQPVQASATTALEIILQKDIQETKIDVINIEWIVPIINYVSNNALDSGVLNILEGLLTKAVKLGDCIHYILPHIKQYQTASKVGDLKCILMLLNVARKSGYSNKMAEDSVQEWKGLISYEVLQNAAVNSSDETRILSLSLIVESPKSTEIFTVGDLDFILWYLKYNMNAQAPSFRQLTLSVMKKFVKRLEDSYKVVKRQKKSHKVDYYIKFLDRLRMLCFDNLIEGANYSRRCVSLQILVWTERLHVEGYHRNWTADCVDRLLIHLEDSYENNKIMALEILESCPVHLFQENKYSISLNLKDILREASSLKPTDCVSAAYKLDFLKRKLPERILDGSCDMPEPVNFKLLTILLDILTRELSVCLESVVCAAREAPMYGILHCMGHFMEQVDSESISINDKWTRLVEDVISTCVAVNTGVAGMVNNSSPEGHLPMDMSGVVVSDEGNSRGMRLDDGRQVTAQMVLLCAWRSVKEVSLLLGTISSRLTISGEGRDVGTLSFKQIDMMVQHFTKLLAETKHRGAFEQAYVGFTKLLSRLWKCRSNELHELPQSCLTDLMAMIESNDQNTSLCATRRSAGLPFMIQALVTTELQVHGNPKCFHSCMATLLRLAQSRSPTNIETRTHCLNILRALFRNSTLDECVAGYVGDGLIVALTGFEGETWAERNSSTLLFSALMVRVFGVQRSKDSDELCIRNKMTGRIFFLRYPYLYDFMLDKLQEVSSNEDAQLLRPSLYPILLLLARLYPSSLEGTVSNLKLVAYVPYVLSCAKSSVLKTRQLAAKAMVPLISPENYTRHLINMFAILSEPGIKRNYCHGILLQVSKLLISKPNDLIIDEITHQHLSRSFDTTLWILEQGIGEKPCYIIIDEYLKIIDLLIWSWSSVIKDEFVHNIITYLHKLIFRNDNVPGPGLEICLSNALYVYFIISNKYNRNILEIIYKSLEHFNYEVILSCLNYLLILYEQINIENHFQEHLKCFQVDILDKLRNEKYINLLCKILYENKYMECQQKSLKLLTLCGNTQKYLTKVNDGEGAMVQQFIKHINRCHDSLVHIYLESLCDYVTTHLTNILHKGGFMEFLRVLLECSSSDNTESTRGVVVKFLESNVAQLLAAEWNGSDKEKFEFKATLWAVIITMLEDDEEVIRQRTSDALTLYIENSKHTIPSKCGEVIMQYIGQREDAAIFVMLALMDFKSEVCLTDETSDECRVFDQNERYNIFLEETIWTSKCATELIDNHQNIDYVLSIIDSDIYRATLDKLCQNNIILFMKILKGDSDVKRCIINPKIKIFIDKICH